MARTKPGPPGLRPFTQNKHNASKTTHALQTNLMASDPFHGVQPDRAATDVDATTAEALRFVGYRGGKDWYQEDPKPLHYCICDAVVEEGGIDAETVVRCGNRDCARAYYHLTCVNLPDHPPMKLGWMCPPCIAQNGIADSYNGLWDIKHSEDKSGPKTWLQEEHDLHIARQTPAKRHQFWQDQIEESEHEEDEEDLAPRTSHPHSQHYPPSLSPPTAVLNPSLPQRGYGEVSSAFPNPYTYPDGVASPPTTPRHGAPATHNHRSLGVRSGLWTNYRQPHQAPPQTGRGKRFRARVSDETDVVVTETNSEIAEMERDEEEGVDEDEGVDGGGGSLRSGESGVREGREMEGGGEGGEVEEEEEMEMESETATEESDEGSLYEERSSGRRR